MNLLKIKCPVCGQILERESRSLICINRHCFDFAKTGYVNLYQNSSTGHHGDDKRMVHARTIFLNQGYYDPLATCVADLAVEILADRDVLVDAGCGEGKYTVEVVRALRNRKINAQIVGIDISKAAVEALAKRSKDVTAIVASSSDIPLFDQSTNLVLNLFAPFFGKEFLRILKPGGKIIRVVPLENHLWELKEAIYSNPYKNDVPSYEEAGFSIEDKKVLSYKIFVEKKEDIQFLFQMTPYYYKTGKADQEKLFHLEKMSITIEFGIIIYRKEL